MKRTRIALAALVIATPAHAKHHHRHHHFARHHHARTAAAHRPQPHPRAAATPLATPIFGDLTADWFRDTVKRLAVAIGNTVGMNADFVHNLQAAFASIPSGSCRVGSGFRSHAEQAALHRQKPGLAAAPGHSNHERGLAADLACHGGALAWLHAHARSFGLTFPMSYEAWHIEPIGATRFASHHRLHYAHHYRQHYARAG